MQREPSLRGPDTFCFLNEERRIGEASTWNDPQADKLWLYNLHYFDDLNARDAKMRQEWHRALIKRWVAENPPGHGNGWEPYPTSLRIVNWIKWSLSGYTLHPEAEHSLAVQARWLRRHLEYHLLGNHVVANAKALIFAGTYFEGKEAEEWNRKGRKLLNRELNEQLLGDGGHFERTPMYHLIVLEDLLDLINLDRASGERLLQYWRDAARRMLDWAVLMRHPDGDVPFFNDAAIGIAPAPEQLDRYGEQVDHAGRTETRSAVLRDSGYIVATYGPATMFVDVAQVRPAYLPGHAHADTLSFELSLMGRRVCVNAGTSTYEVNELRAWQRGTSAHNTVRVDRADSSEMWAAFRVARRARVSVRSIELGDAEMNISASHDGYRRLAGTPEHRRSYRLNERWLTVADEIVGRGKHDLETFVHFHPDVQVIKTGAKLLELRLRETEATLATVAFRGSGTLEVHDGHWYPGFGQCISNQRCVFRQFRTQLPVSQNFTIHWSDTPSPN